MTEEKGGPFYLYRCYDAEARLIYVGRTANLWRRQRQHRDKSWWAPQVVSVRAKLYPTKGKAIAAERMAIAKERPRWNVDYRHLYRQYWMEPRDYVDYVRARREAVCPHDCVALGVPLPTVSSYRYDLMLKLQAEYRERFGGHLDLGPDPRFDCSEVAS